MGKIVPTADLYSLQVLVALKATLGNVNKVALATSLTFRTIAKALSGVQPSEDSMRKIVAAALRLLPEAELLECGVLQRPEERREENLIVQEEEVQELEMKGTPVLNFEKVGGQYIQRPLVVKQAESTTEEEGSMPEDALDNSRHTPVSASPMLTKRCTRCGRVQSVTMFRHRSAAKDGLQHWCKNCQDGRVAELWRDRTDQEVGISATPTTTALASHTPSTDHPETLSESVLSLAVRIAELEKQNVALLESSAKLKRVVAELTAALRTATAMAEMLSRFGDASVSDH